MIQIKTVKLSRKLDIFIVFFISFVMSACLNFDNNKIVSGVFKGKAESLLGDISIQVWIEENDIKHIDILSYYDTPAYSNTVFKILPKQITDKNSTNVDIITGATTTSTALINAVEDALQKAKHE